MDTLVDVVLGRETPYITYAIPVFFLLMGVELLAGWWTHRDLYRLSDSINDLSCGILQQLLGIFLRTVLFVGYLFLFEHFRLLEMQSFSPAGKWAAAIALFFGVDFCYYWFHRASHEMNAPWAGHIVHHQSEEYNLAVALRQGALQSAFSWVFYLPLAWIGFPPLWFVAMSSFNTLYQFWIHTRAIGKLGPLEWFLNTPSHHRVHHGRNPKYLDKNHGGTLIVWDRLFGTFQVEEEEPVYGITRPLSSWNPIWANVHEFVELWDDAKAAPCWTDKIKIWFMPPGWRPRGLPERPLPPEVRPDTVTKYETPVPRGLAAYLFVQFVVLLAISVGVLAAKDVEPLFLVPPVLLVVLGLTNLGGIYERRSWALALELVRFLAQIPLAIGYAPDRLSAAIAAGAAALFGAASLPWLLAYRKEFPPFFAPSRDAAALSGSLPAEG